MWNNANGLNTSWVIKCFVEITHTKSDNGIIQTATKRHQINFYVSLTYTLCTLFDLMEKLCSWRHFWHSKLMREMVLRINKKSEFLVNIWRLKSSMIFKSSIKYSRCNRKLDFFHQSSSFFLSRNLLDVEFFRKRSMKYRKNALKLRRKPQNPAKCPKTPKNDLQFQKMFIDILKLSIDLKKMFS